MTTSVDALAPPTPDVARAVFSYWTPRRVIWTLVGLGLVLRAWVVASGYFYWDDYIFQGRAWRLPLDWDYLMHGHDGHLMPGAFLLQWPMTQHFALTYLPMAVLLVLGQVVVVVLVARLCLSLWGPRWLAAVPVAIVTVTPLTLPTNTWWAAALNGIPLQIALSVSLLAGLRWWRSGRQRYLWGALLVWVVLLTFSEKVLVVPWAVLAAVPVLDAGRRPLRAWGRVLRRTWPVWSAYLVLSVGYVVFYLRIVGKQPSADATPAQVADLLGRGIVTTVVPGIFGGPIAWEPIGFGSAIGQPPWWFVALCAELLLLLVIVSSARSRRARRAWLWAFAYVLGDLALVATGRLNAYVAPEVVQGLRYTADAAVPLAIAVGVALESLAPRARSVVSRIPGVDPVIALRVAVAALIVGIASVSAVSTAHYRAIWEDNPSRAYMATAADQLARIKDGPSLVDQPVSIDVLYGLAYPYNQASWLLSPISPRPEFADPTTDLRLLDDFGVVRPALVEGPGAAPGPNGDCGWLVKGDQDILLSSEIIDFVHTVRVGYLAGGDGSATLALGDGEPRAFAVHKGLNEVIMTLSGGGRALRVRDLTPGVSLCTNDVRVGHPVVAK